MSVVVVGLNQRTVPLHVLERMTVSKAQLPKALLQVRQRAQVHEAVIVSTCLRTEVYVAAERFHGAVDEIREFLAEWSGTSVDQLGEFGDRIYAHYEDGAATHLFEVASGLDSAVLGEGEILGQVRDAWQMAKAEQMAGPVLDSLFRHAVEVGKRARSETAIAKGITSVSQAAVSMAAHQLGGLDQRTILVLGAGEMGEGMAAALAGASPSGTVLVANRTPRTAATLAAKIGGEAIDLAAVPQALERVDVLLASTSSPTVLMEAADIAPVMAQRPDRPLLVVDIAVPRDIDPQVGEIPGVTLLDADDLRAFAEAGRAGRRAEIKLVQAIIAEEVARFTAQTSARAVAPVIVALRERAERIRLSELERFRAGLADLTPEQRDAVDAATKGVIAKLLHEPTVGLKDAAGGPAGERLVEAARLLFDLD